MKAVILAAVMTLASMLLATAMFRLKPIEHRALALLYIYAGVLVVLVAANLVTPDDLSFLPRDMLAEPRWFDLASGVFFYSAAFFGGVMQLYNLADRGFSLRILIDLLESPGQCAAAEALYSGYSRGKGLGWMYGKRIAGMVDNDLVVSHGGTLALTARGLKAANLYARLRRFLNAGPG